MRVLLKNVVIEYFNNSYHEIIVRRPAKRMEISADRLIHQSHRVTRRRCRQDEEVTTLMLLDNFIIPLSLKKIVYKLI